MRFTGAIWLQLLLIYREAHGNRICIKNETKTKALGNPHGLHVTFIMFLSCWFNVNVLRNI